MSTFDPSSAHDSAFTVVADAEPKGVDVEYRENSKAKSRHFRSLNDAEAFFRSCVSDRNCTDIEIIDATGRTLKRSDSDEAKNDAQSVQAILNQIKRSNRLEDRSEYSVQDLMQMYTLDERGAKELESLIKKAMRGDSANDAVESLFAINVLFNTPWGYKSSIPTIKRYEVKAANVQAAMKEAKSAFARDYSLSSDDVKKLSAANVSI